MSGKQPSGKETVILAITLERELYRKLRTIPELSAALPVVRRLDGGDELWLFVVLPAQLEKALEARITDILVMTAGFDMSRCCTYQLSTLPLTRSGRVMRRATEKFVNHLAVPNRLQMRNPEVLEEIVRVVSSEEPDS